MVDSNQAPDPSLQKLVNVLGPAQAEVVITETMRRLGLTELRSPDDRFRFGAALIKKGGVLEAIGRAIKIQAILTGARADD